MHRLGCGLVLPCPACAHGHTAVPVIIRMPVIYTGSFCSRVRVLVHSHCGHSSLARYSKIELRGIYLWFYENWESTFKQIVDGKVSNNMVKVILSLLFIHL